MHSSHRRTAQLLCAVLLGLGTTTAASSAAVADGPSPVADSRPASAISELAAQQLKTSTPGTYRVSGRVMDGDSFLFPLAHSPVTVRALGADATAFGHCQARTSKTGVFSCTMNLTAGEARWIEAQFHGSGAFAPTVSYLELTSPALR